MGKKTFKNTGLTYEKFLAKVADYALLIASGMVDTSRLDRISENYHIRILDIGQFELFLYVQRLLGDDLPKSLRDEDYDKLGGATYFRGVSDIDHLASLLCDGYYHHGNGTSGDGIYASYAIDSYVLSASKNHREQVMQFKLSEDSNIFGSECLILLSSCLKKDKSFTPRDVLEVGNKSTRGDLELDQKIHRRIAEFLQREEVVRFMKFYRKLDKNRLAAFQNLVLYSSNLALLLGGDAIRFRYYITDADDRIIVLNRNKMVLSKSERKRILFQSSIYNEDGTINLADKDAYLSKMLGE